MNSITKYIKNYKYSVPLAIIIVVILAIFIFRGNAKVTAETISATKATVSQEVTVTGRVVSAEKVDLSIVSGGKVVSINARVGDQVALGQTLLRVDSLDLQIRLGKQQATLEKYQLVLDKEEPKTDAQDDLAKAYDDGFTAVSDAFLDLPEIVTGLEDVLGESNVSSESSRRSGETAEDYRDQADELYYEAQDVFQTNRINFRKLDRNSPKEDIEAIIVETYNTAKVLTDAITSAKNLVDYLAEDTGNTSNFTSSQDTLSEYTDTVNAHLSNLFAIKTTIKDSRVGVTDRASDIRSDEIDVRLAELDIEDTRAQIRNRSIVAPYAGIITKINAKVGETISPGSPIVSIISANQFEIETNIPEADMAKIKVGADSDVILDAYGSDVIFKAKVASIDPAETIIDGVATYKTTTQFLVKDDRIKSGMTANLTIKGESKENVIAIPQRAVITKDDGKFVQVVVGDKVVEKPVKTGLRGSDGIIEIVSGILEGENIVVFSE